MQYVKISTRVCFLIFLLSFSACAHSRGTGLPTKLEKGSVFEFELPSLEGGLVRSQAYRGRVLLVDVWATWCAPCERSFPFYAQLYEQLEARGFDVVAVSVDERAEDAARWLEERKLPFHFVHDPEGNIPERIGLRTMPSAVVLDRDGQVVGVHAGFEEGDRFLIERMIRAAFGDEDIPRVFEAEATQSN